MLHFGWVVVVVIFLIGTVHWARVAFGLGTRGYHFRAISLN